MCNIYYITNHTQVKWRYDQTEVVGLEFWFETYEQVASGGFVDIVIVVVSTLTSFQTWNIQHNGSNNKHEPVKCV